MKKNLCICAMVGIGISLVLLMGCVGKRETNNEVDENRDSDSVRTVEYDLEVLEEYFKGCNQLIPEYLGVEHQYLRFKDVDQRFPVESIRPWGYSVYRVKQGGCYYVFWSSRNVYEDSMVTDDSTVIFTTYVAPLLKDLSVFDTLEPGISTAEDVEAIDPYFEMSFTRSYGIYSYSFLDNDNLLEIEYYQPEEGDIYEDLVVKEMTVVPRLEYHASAYGFILPEDLP